MLVGLSGPTITLSPGDEHDFPRDEALRFIEAGFAVPVGEQIIETAAVAPQAERRTRKKRA